MNQEARMSGSSSEFVASLIEVGRLGHLPDPWPSSLRRHVHLSQDLQHFERGMEHSLDRDHLANLIRGLVLYLAALGGGPGSVSPVIYLYLAFVRRFPDHEPALTAFVRDNTTNDYEPFGFCGHLGARSWAEYLVLSARHDEATAVAHIAHNAHQGRFRLARATRALRSAVARGYVPDVVAILANGADWKSVVTSSGSLVDLAVKRGRLAMTDFLRERAIQ